MSGIVVDRRAAFIAGAQGVLKVPLGHDVENGEPVVLDFHLDNNIGVFGAVGLGKSHLVRKVVEHWVRVVQPFYASYGMAAPLVVYDPKLGWGYERYRSHISEFLICDAKLDGVYDLFIKADALAWHYYERNAAAIGRAHAADISIDEYLAACVPPVLFIWEELHATFTSIRLRGTGRLLPPDGGPAKDGKACFDYAQGLLERQLCLARGMGLKQVIVAQSPISNVIKSEIKQNLSGKLIFGTWLTAGNEQSVFGDALPKDFSFRGGRGRAVALLGGERWDLQVSP